MNLADSVEYCEFPADYELPHVLRNTSSFKPLDSVSRRSFPKLMKNSHDFIWLRIKFTIPPELQNRDVALYISQLRSASRLYLNNNVVRQYGEFPPHEVSSGIQTCYYVFTRNNIMQDKENIIYIKVWPGAFGTLSNTIFLGEQSDVYHHAEHTTFFNSRIALFFCGVLFVIFFIHIFLYLVSTKTKEIKNYIYYGLLNFYSIHFLIAVFVSEVQWSTLVSISYLWFFKVFFCFGAYSAIYFANSFILSYMQYPPTVKGICIRIGILLVSVIFAFCMPSIEAYYHFFAVFLFLGAIPFTYSIKKMIDAWFDKEKKPYVISLLIGFAPVLLSIVADVILHLLLKKDEIPIITLFGWQVTLYIFLGYMLKRFGTMYINNTNLKGQLEEFSAHLEDVVSIRTKELSEANSILSQGIETVSHVQHNFLPSKNKTFKGWELAICYKPHDNNVSGDLYDYYNSDNTLDGLGLFDVSGHGIPAGLMTILAKGIISQHFLNGLAQQESISDVLKEINKTYIKEKVDLDNYITGLLFRFSGFNNKEICSVELANAGHPAPLFYDSKSGEVSELKLSDPSQQYGIIGIKDFDVSFPPINIRMKTNDIIVCFTDGLTESLNAERDEYSKSKVIKVIQEHSKLSAQNLLDKIVEDLDNFTGEQGQTDDITIVVLKRTSPKDYIEEI